MDLIGFLVALFVLAVVFTIILFVARKAPIEEPFKGVIIWVIYAIGALFLIALLLQLFGVHQAFNLAPLRLR